MKILEISKYFPPEYGGIETYVYYLSRELSKLGNEVTVLCATKGESRMELVHGVRIIRFKELGTISNAPIVPQFISKSLSLDFDVIHLHFPNPIGEIASISAHILRNKPIIVTYHGDVIRGNLHSKALSCMYKYLISIPVFKMSKNIIATSSEYASISKMLRMFNSKVKIIPPGVDFSRFTLSVNKSLEHEFASKQRNKLILFIGRLVPFKGVKYLIDAMRHVKGRGHKAELIIIGDGPLKKNLEDQTDKLDLKDFVFFAGNVPSIDYLSYLSKSDVVVLPSVGKQESFGLVLLEAMACAKPVIGSELGAMPYIIDDGKTGFLAQPKNPKDIAEKICEILENERLAKEMGREGRRKVEEEFQWSTVGEKFNKLLGE